MTTRRSRRVNGEPALALKPTAGAKSSSGSATTGIELLEMATFPQPTTKGGLDMITIATQNGTDISRDHNIRNRKVTDKEKHIDPLGHYEIWRDETIAHAYERLFRTACKHYNEKQKREERKMTPSKYRATVESNPQQNVAYEMVVGVYGTQEEVPNELRKIILEEYVRNWKKRNPNLEMIGAYYHEDEHSPHVHIDYIPIAHGYKRGLETQTGLNKALEEQGISPTGKSKVTPQIIWEAKENQALEDICNHYGLTVEHPQRGGKAKHLETDVYKATKQMETLTMQVGMLQDKVVTLQQQTEIKQKTLETLDEAISEKQNVLDNLLEEILNKIRNLEKRMRMIFNKPSPEEQTKIVSEITQALQNVENEMDFDLDF